MHIPYHINWILINNKWNKYLLCFFPSMDPMHLHMLFTSELAAMYAGQETAFRELPASAVIMLQKIISPGFSIKNKTNLHGTLRWIDHTICCALKMTLNMHKFRSSVLRATVFPTMFIITFRRFCHLKKLHVDSEGSYFIGRLDYEWLHYLK